MKNRLPPGGCYTNCYPAQTNSPGISNEKPGLFCEFAGWCRAATPSPA